MKEKGKRREEKRNYWTTKIKTGRMPINWIKRVNLPNQKEFSTSAQYVKTLWEATRNPSSHDVTEYGPTFQRRHRNDDTHLSVMRRHQNLVFGRRHQRHERTHQPLMIRQQKNLAFHTHERKRNWWSTPKIVEQKGIIIHDVKKL